MLLLDLVAQVVYSVLRAVRQQVRGDAGRRRLRSLGVLVAIARRHPAALIYHWSVFVTGPHGAARKRQVGRCCARRSHS